MQNSTRVALACARTKRSREEEKWMQCKPNDKHIVINRYVYKSYNSISVAPFFGMFASTFCSMLMNSLARLRFSLSFYSSVSYGLPVHLLIIMLALQNLIHVIAWWLSLNSALGNNVFAELQLHAFVLHPKKNDKPPQKETDFAERKFMRYQKKNITSFIFHTVVFGKMLNGTQILPHMMKKPKANGGDDGREKNLRQTTTQAKSHQDQAHNKSNAMR